jgi:hypothetical protein
MQAGFRQRHRNSEDANPFHETSYASQRGPRLSPCHRQGVIKLLVVSGIVDGHRMRFNPTYDRDRKGCVNPA